MMIIKEHQINTQSNEPTKPSLTLNKVEGPTSRGRISVMPVIWKTFAVTALVLAGIAAIPIGLFMLVILIGIVATGTSNNLADFIVGGALLYSFFLVLLAALPLAAAFFSYRYLSGGHSLFSVVAIVIMLGYVYFATNYPGEIINWASNLVSCHALTCSS
jgi:uncharacterized membrane protein